MTGTARALCLAAPPLALSGWWLGYLPLTALGLAAAGAVAVGVAWTAWTPAVDDRRRVDPPRVGVGGEAVEVVELRNSGTRRSRATALVDTAEGGERQVHHIPPLDPGERTLVTTALATGRRGVVRRGPGALAWTDPLELVRRTRPLTGTASLWVHPRVHEIPPLPDEHAHDAATGDAASTTPGDAGFGSLREYVAGDDRRQIHWRSSARAGQLMVRQPVASRPRGVTVLLDGRAGHHDTASFELAVEITASVLVSCANARFRGRLVGTGSARIRHLDPERRSSATDLLDHLAEVQPDAGSLTVALQLASSQPGPLVIVTPVPGGDLSTGIPPQARTGTTVVVQVRPDAAPPPGRPGLVCLSVGTGDEFARAWARLVRR